MAAYDTVEKKMAFFDPSRAKDFLFISGTKVRTKFNSVSVVYPAFIQVAIGLRVMNHIGYAFLLL